MVGRRGARLSESETRALRSAVDAVDRGKDSLTSAVPGPRSPGRVLAEALLEFEGALAEAGSLMPGWRTPESEAAWGACSDALEESAGMAERLRLEAPALDFESLVMVLKDLIAPLEAFEEAERLLRRGSRW
ncbi:MAG TPA: hypothetical protein VGS09_12905 [Actinomycetota bacterium]|nr:hypothetical protein [Actinomycetota bacterium]